MNVNNKICILVVCLLYHINNVHGTASNSLSDCNAVAAKFRTTCNSSVPVANISTTIGTPVTCPNLTGLACPGSTSSGSCVFYHKLCVTCFTNGSSSTVKIRVQTNGLPPFCPNLPSPNITFIELNIDFEVNFNPDVSVNSPNVNVTTQSALNTAVCNLTSLTRVPSWSNYRSYSSINIDIFSGITIDGVSVLNVNSANDADPYFTPSGSAAESVDECIAHCQIFGIYHYHTGSSCPVTASSSTLIRACAQNTACRSNIATYSISMFSSNRTLTLIGIAKDGHLIYGPYTSNGIQVTSGFDVCNGMFYDSIGNYAYFTTQTYPYLIGCFGPGNYPSILPNCTTNPPSSYTMSSFLTSNTSTTTVLSSSQATSSSSQATSSSSQATSSSSQTASLSSQATSSSSQTASQSNINSSININYIFIMLLNTIINMYFISSNGVVLLN